MDNANEILFGLAGVSKSYAIRQGFLRRGRTFNAVDHLDLKLCRGRAYGLVGESGSGKTTLAGLLAGLLAPSSGSIIFDGVSLNEVLKQDPYAFRAKVQMVFQNPYLSLDPKWKIREIVGEGIRGLKSSVRSLRTEKALESVALPLDYLQRKPGELSGGERQRVAIARALAMEPDFLILDEPTSQLDVSIQAQIISLLKRLQKSLRVGMLFISHDVALVSQIAEEILVFHQGKLVEQGNKRSVLLSPAVSYTRNLLDSLPEWP